MLERTVMFCYNPLWNGVVFVLVSTYLFLVIELNNKVLHGFNQTEPIQAEALAQEAC